MSDVTEISVSTVTSRVIGPLRVAATDAGICAIAFADWADHLLLERWLDHGARTVARSHPLIAAFAREVAEYDAGRLRAFATAVDLGAMPEFSQKVLRETHRIPFGKSASYADLAELVGKPRAFRAIGQVMRRNPLPLLIPCHRVIASEHRIGGFTPGIELKQRLLRHEKCKSVELTDSPAPGTLAHQMQ